LTVDSTAVQFSTLKAKDSGGFIFQENDGTQIGSWSDTGSLTVGKSSSTNTLLVNANDSSTGVTGLTLFGANTFGGGVSVVWQDSWSGDGGGVRAKIFGDVPGSNDGRLTFQIRKAGTLINVARCTAPGQWTFSESEFTGTHIIYGETKCVKGGGDGPNTGSGIVTSSLGKTIAASGNYIISAEQGSFMGMLAITGSRSGNGNIQTQKFFLIYNPGNGTTQLTSIGTDKNGSSGGHSYTVATAAGSASITVTNSDGSNAMDFAYYLTSLPTQ
jgi:hypothetical protein